MWGSGLDTWLVWWGDMEKCRDGGSSGPRSWAFLPEKMPFRVPVGCRTPLPHHTAEVSLDESRCQAVHPNVPLGQL